jgi:ABC-type uncharacterized transport system auxiliary subunit
MPAHPILKTTQLTRLALTVLAALSLSGCLSKPPLVKQTFAFQIPPAGTNSPSSASSGVLEIRRITVASAFDNQSFIYRTGPYSYERDPYAEFLVPPEEILLAPMQAYFRDSGLFRDVVVRGSAVKPDVILEVQVMELYGDFQNKTEPDAVLRLKFTFLNANGSSGRSSKQILLEKEYAERISFKTRTASALMAAWNEDLEKILPAVSLDLKPALSR